MSPTKVGPQPAEVLIIRAGYATDLLWTRALHLAIKHHRIVKAIDAEGRVLSALPEDDW